MYNESPTINRVCDVDINQYLVAKFGSDADHAALATTHTDKIAGIADLKGLTGKRIDLIRHGIAEGRLGGVVTYGDLLTVNADSKLVTVTEEMANAGDVEIIGTALASGVLDDIIPIDVNIHRLSRLTAIAGASLITDASFVIGAETGDEINVAVQLLDGLDDPITEAAIVTVFLSDASTGIGITETAPDGDIAIGTNGAILGELVADKVFQVQTEATGAFDLDIGEAAAGTWYLVVVLPNGKQVVSGAITFAGA